MKFWTCRKSWMQSAKNTLICLMGCAIGDNAVILTFQLVAPKTSMFLVMVLAMAAGLFSSVSLETLILLRQFSFGRSVKIALGMSIISMLMMEAAANGASILFAGGNRLALSVWSIIPAWAVGYLAAWLYNYIQLRKYGRACHG